MKRVTSAQLLLWFFFFQGYLSRNWHNHTWRFFHFGNIRSNKGMLIPPGFTRRCNRYHVGRVNTATGLLIYNTNAAITGGSGVGYYYFNGTQWERLTTSSQWGDDDFYEEGTTAAPKCHYGWYIYPWECRHWQKYGRLGVGRWGRPRGHGFLF